MKTFLSCIVLLFVLHCALGAHDLNEEYRFSADLDPGYKLHWTFDLEAGTIAFAVNVSTTGWVGFGLSPTGQMPGSDVVIGWVQSNGQVEFQDRYAIGRFLPPVDPSQDWILVSGEEENGYTILEFTRNLATCDENDLEIEANTARIVWSYHSSDPTSASSIPIHEEMGSASLNLLAGLLEERVEPDSDIFTVLAGNITIPAVDTTYWCRVGELPAEVQEQERFIFKVSPSIEEATSRYVHHILVYICAGLNDTHLGASNVCEDHHIDIQTCRGGEIIAAWAVGGTDFVFPPGVALPVGGEGARRYYLIEMHYDNPNLDSGMVDNSGISFSYLSTQPAQIAGTIGFGAPVSPALIIPPGSPDFTITSFCSRECTEAHLPAEGVKVFGSLLHTHLAGHGLLVEHFRETECGLREGLKPIDENRQYDFNYQQTTILPEELTVLPGDELKLQCFYRTPGYTNVTLGGESTREEMCFSFLYYYPRTDLSFCISAPELPGYQGFAMQHLDPSMHEDFSKSIRTEDYSLAHSTLNSIDWTPEAIDSLQQVFTGGSHYAVCNGVQGGPPIVTIGNSIPTADCPYVRADTCTGEPGSQGRCCEIEDSGAANTTTGSIPTTNPCAGEPGSQGGFCGSSGAAKLSQLSALVSIIAMTLIAILF